MKTMNKLVLTFVIWILFGCNHSNEGRTVYHFFQNKHTRFSNTECNYWSTNNTFHLTSLGNTTFHSITCRKVKETNKSITFIPLDELRMMISKKRKSQDLNQLNVHFEHGKLQTDDLLKIAYNDMLYSLNDFPILEAKKRDSLSFNVSLNNQKTAFAFRYFNFDYSDLDISTKRTVDAIVVNKQKDEIYFFLNGKKCLSIHKFKNWTFE